MQQKMIFRKCIIKTIHLLAIIGVSPLVSDKKVYYMNTIG